MNVSLHSGFVHRADSDFLLTNENNMNTYLILAIVLLCCANPLVGLIALLAVLNAEND